MPNVETVHIPVSSFTCPGCDCGMCVSAAITSVDLLEGVEHVRVDRFRKRFVVRVQEDSVEEDAIRERIAAAGVAVTPSDQ